MKRLLVEADLDEGVRTLDNKQEGDECKFSWWDVRKWDKLLPF